MDMKTMIDTERAEVDLYAYKGADFVKTARFKLDGQPEDMTGYTAAMQIRKTMNGDLITDVTIDITPEQGLVQMVIDAETTAAIDPGAYVWDLKITDDTNVVRYDLYGKFYVYGRSTE